MRSTNLVTRGAVAFGVVAALVVGAAGVGSGCSSSGESKGPVSVPMTLKPREPLNVTAAAGGLPETSLWVAPVVDKRPEAQKDKVGHNSEEGTPVPVYPGGSSVEDFFHQTLVEQLGNAGLTMAENKTAAQRVLVPTLKTFWVEETGTYDGRVIASFELQDNAGKKLWPAGAAASFTGTAGNWGRSLNPENYQQTFSDATLRMIEGLLANPGFQKGLNTTQAAPAAANAAPAAATDDAAAPAAENPLRRPAPASDAAPPDEPPATEDDAAIPPAPGAENPLGRPAPATDTPEPATPTAPDAGEAVDQAGGAATNAAATETPLATGEDDNK